jgi:hypothetical protein
VFKVYFIDAISACKMFEGTKEELAREIGRLLRWATESGQALEIARV